MSRGGRWVRQGPVRGGKLPEQVSAAPGTGAKPFLGKFEPP